jgi:uncharacterized Fe-S cluster-containing radical SAM superfamily protein
VIAPPAKPIDTVKFAQLLRERAIDVPRRRLLLSRLAGSDQEIDLTVPSNCEGYGRVRHFRIATALGWPRNPLPIVPACKALGLEVPSVMRAQVFQNAACAWRCWYCFVPDNLLRADPKRSAWFAAEELVALYSQETDPPAIIDLSGGSPDLVPEWTLWMMEALASAGLDRSTYLWTDDNLSTSYLFDLDSRELDRMVAYRNYGRVCCFKGFDDRSFAFNTRAAPGDFDRQFEIMGRLLALGLDLYGYVTLTSCHAEGIRGGIQALFDRLQELDSNLPLRVVPLQIQRFTPMMARFDPARERSLQVQEEAIAAWISELYARFNCTLRSAPITDVPLSNGSGLE